MSATSASHDRYISIFSPEGKLFQIEYAFTAVENANVTALALKCKNCAVVGVEKKVAFSEMNKDKLLLMDKATSLHRISQGVGGAFVGVTPDAAATARKAAEEAELFQAEYGHEASALYVVKRLALQNQVLTQYAYARLQACNGIVIGIDPNRRVPELYKFDLAGFYCGWNATCINKRESQAMSLLTDAVENKPNDTLKDVVVTLLNAFQDLLNKEVGAADVEIGVVTVENPAFRILSAAEIAGFLSNRDA